MRLLLVNPNSTASMTEKAAIAARAVARPDTEIVATNPADGPASIQGFHDVAMCLPGLLREIARFDDVDGVIIACFDDTGLDAARCAVDAPVLGIGEAAFHAASMLSCRFGVVTTLSRSVPGIEANLVRYGLANRCARVRASDIPVLDLEAGDRETYEKLSNEVRRVIHEDGAEAVVLGCAGMADLSTQLAAEHGVPMIDGIVCATTFVEALVTSGLKTSKHGGYASIQNALPG
ncbi:MAG: aspartate/glutamate racemase family protein [Hyphomicrobiaceae bacterium]